MSSPRRPKPRFGWTKERATTTSGPRPFLPGERVRGNHFGEGTVLPDDGAYPGSVYVEQDDGYALHYEPDILTHID